MWAFGTLIYSSVHSFSKNIVHCTSSNLSNFTPLSLPTFSVSRPNLIFWKNYSAASGDTLLLLPYKLTILLLFVPLLFFIINKLTKTALSSTVSSVVDQENGCFEDILLVITFFISFYLTLFNNIFSTDCSFNHFFYSPSVFLFFATVIILTPVTLLYNFGFYFVSVLRGESATLFFGFELLLDIVALVAYFTRLVVQLSRIVLISFSYYSITHLNLSSDILYTSIFSLTPTDFFVSSSALFTICWVLGEIAHSLAVISIQTISLTVIVLWLF